MKNIKLKKYRHLKISYKYNSLTNYLKNINFILVFYYDFLSTQQKLNLKKELKSKNLKIVHIKNGSNINILMNRISSFRLQRMAISVISLINLRFRWSEFLSAYAEI